MKTIILNWVLGEGGEVKCFVNFKNKSVRYLQRGVSRLMSNWVLGGSSGFVIASIFAKELIYF